MGVAGVYSATDTRLAERKIRKDGRRRETRRKRNYVHYAITLRRVQKY